MTEFTGDGLRVNPQDLAAISPDGEDDDRMFHHDGSSAISVVGGGSDSTRGYYIWSSGDAAWFPLFENADKIDGKEAGDFLWRDGSLAMESNLDAGNHGVINLTQASGGTGGINLNTNNVEIHSNETGASVQLKDNNGLLLAEGIEGGDFKVPNGSLYEQGNRIATRTWTNNNADVPNADYADNANNLDGKNASAFLHVTGDQMEGVLDVGGNDVKDGGTVKYDTSTGNFVQSALGGPASSLSSFPLPNADLSNSSVTVTAGNQLTGGGSVSLGGTVTLDVDESGLNADTFDGNDSSYFAALSEAETVSGAWTFSTSPSLPSSSISDDNLDFATHSVSLPVTKYANGLSGEEVYRMELQSGESAEVHRLEIQPKSGGNVLDLNVDVYDESTGTVIASTNDVATGSPIASSSSGANVLVRVSNGSGSSQNVSISGEIHIV